MSNEINVTPASEMSTSQTGVEEWRDITDPRVVPGRYQVSKKHARYTELAVLTLAFLPWLPDQPLPHSSRVVDVF